MIQNDRKKYIMKTANHDGIVSIPEVAAKYGVSVETIRRDVNELCRENKLTKVHGGAVPVGNTVRRESVVRKKQTVIPEESMTVGLYGAKLIKNGDIVMFDCGDFAQMIASAVSGLRDVTFITNSIPIASILLDKYNAGNFTGKVIMMGGELNERGKFTASPETFEQLNNYHSDICFVTASAVSPEGVASQDSFGSSVSALMIKHSACPVLATESEKFGRNSLSRFAPISSFRYIITDTDKEISEEFHQLFEKAQINFKAVALK